MMSFLLCTKALSDQSLSMGMWCGTLVKQPNSQMILKKIKRELAKLFWVSVIIHIVRLLTPVGSVLYMTEEMIAAESLLLV